MKIKKYHRFTPSNFNHQISIQNQVLSKYDFYYTLLDRKLIEQASKLALHCRKHVDPLYDVVELQGLSIQNLVTKVYNAIERHDFSFKRRFDVEIPKDKFENRTISYIPIEQYVMRFMLAIRLSDIVQFSPNTFGGKEDVFEYEKGYIYDKIGADFNQWQLSIIKNHQASWIAIADIRKYYDSIQLDILQNIIVQLISNDSSELLNKFIKEIINSIDIGNRVDDFFQNLILMDVDKVLEEKPILYGRLCDDFRIYGNSEQDVMSSYTLLNELLTKKGFEINEQKQFVEYKVTKKDDKGYDAYSIRPDYFWNTFPSLELKHIKNTEKENVLKIFYNTYLAGYQTRYFEDIRKHSGNYTLILGMSCGVSTNFER